MGTCYLRFNNCSSIDREFGWSRYFPRKMAYFNFITSACFDAKVINMYIHETGDADDKDSEDEDWVDSDKNCFDLFNDTETDEEDSQ